MNTTRVSDLTVDELLTLLKPIIFEAMREAVAGTGLPVRKENRPPLDLPVIDVGPWPKDLTLRREELYGDDER